MQPRLFFTGSNLFRHWFFALWIIHGYVHQSMKSLEIILYFDFFVSPDDCVAYVHNKSSVPSCGGIGAKLFEVNKFIHQHTTVTISVSPINIL